MSSNKKVRLLKSIIVLERSKSDIFRPVFRTRFMLNVRLKVLTTKYTLIYTPSYYLSIPARHPNASKYTHLQRDAVYIE